MNTNVAEFTTDELHTIFPTATFSGTFPPDISTVCGISTDTRTTANGNLFIALRGEHFDAHSLLGQAVEAGAIALITQSSARQDFSEQFESLPEHILLIEVEDTLRALGDIALFHRKRFSIPLIAIGGSAGKTTTKDMTAHILSRQYSVLKTEANYNNRIGVPLTLLQLNQTHSVAVIEVGTNEPGEIAELARITAPTHALLTNIGKEHLEKLKSLSGVFDEERALFDYALTLNSMILVNADDPRLARFAGQPQTLSFGLKSAADIKCICDLDDDARPLVTISFGTDSAKILLNTIGLASAKNALAAASVGFALGMSAESIGYGLIEYIPTSSEDHGYARMVMEEIRLRFGSIMILNDSYNANPDSMRAALDTLRAIGTPGKRIAVLGDMRELGESSATEHYALIYEAAFDDAFSMVFVLGAEMEKAHIRFSKEYKNTRVVRCASQDQLLTILRDILVKDDVVLIKGSRGMKLETLIASIKQLHQKA